MNNRKRNFTTEDFKEYAKKIKKINQFCIEKKILPTKNNDTYYFSINNTNYIVSNKSKDYYKGEAIYINASKLKIQGIYNNLEKGISLDDKGNIIATDKEAHNYSKINVENIKEARTKNILDVAENLGITLKKVGSQTYQWEEHDSFMVTPTKNTWYWNSKDVGGDPIFLVQTMKNVSFREAVSYLLDSKFLEYEEKEIKKEPFSYYLEKLEESHFNNGKNYLKKERGLSEETINTFLKDGNISEAKHYTGDLLEPVIVFKFKDQDNNITGASLQGVERHDEFHDRGYLKRIMKNSDGIDGFTFDIGKPKRLVFCEAPIDLMSYYELHKDKLQDVRLVAMDGLKEATISRKFVELIEEVKEQKSYQSPVQKSQQLGKLASMTNYFDTPKNGCIITLAVDNDKAGIDFINKLQKKGIKFKTDLPPINLNQTKMDWNDFLKQENRKGKTLTEKKSKIQEELTSFVERNGLKFEKENNINNAIIL